MRCILLLLVPGLMVLAACAAGSTLPATGAPSALSVLPARPPDMVGRITQQQGDRMLVAARPAETAGEQPISFRLGNATRIFRRTGQDLQDATVAELVVGREVQVWHTGPVAESFPAQATASVIVVQLPRQGGGL